MAAEAGISNTAVTEHRRRVYLDHSLRSPLRPEALEIWKSIGNLPLALPSSPHRSGRHAADFLEGCRGAVAGLLGRRKEGGVCFFSSFVIAVHSCLDAAAVHCNRDVGTVLLSVAESHTMRQAVLSWASLRKWRVVEVLCDPSGCCSMSEWSRVFSKLHDLGAIVVCCSASGDVGTLQPGRELADAASKAGLCLVRDVSSAYCWIEPESEIFCGDFLVGSASRMGAADFGAFAVFSGQPPQITEPEPLTLAAAVKVITEQWCSASAICVNSMRNTRRFFFNQLTERVSGIRLLGEAEEKQRLPHVLGVRIPGVETEALSLVCDLRGIEFSSSPACVSQAARESHFLLALGLTPREARECCTLSVGPETSTEDAEFAAEIIAAGVRRLMSI